MARDSYDDAYARPVRRLLVAVLVICLIALVILWRIDNPRVERMRAAIVDRVVPNMEWAMAPVTGVARIFDDFQSYARLFEQNQELRRELQQMRAWREAALQLEQEKRAASRPEPGAARPRTDLRHRPCPCRQRLALPAVGPDQCGRPRRHPRRLGHHGRSGRRGARLGRGREDVARAASDRQQQPHPGDDPALGATGAPDGGQFAGADARFHRRARGREPGRPHHHLG